MIKECHHLALLSIAQDLRWFQMEKESIMEQKQSIQMELEAFRNSILKVEQAQKSLKEKS